MNAVINEIIIKQCVMLRHFCEVNIKDLAENMDADEETIIKFENGETIENLTQFGNKYILSLSRICSKNIDFHAMLKRCCMILDLDYDAFIKQIYDCKATAIADHGTKHDIVETLSTSMWSAKQGMYNMNRMLATNERLIQMVEQVDKKSTKQMDELKLQNEILEQMLLEVHGDKFIDALKAQKDKAKGKRKTAINKIVKRQVKVKV